MQREDLSSKCSASDVTTATDSIYQEGLHWTRGPLLGTGAFSICYQGRDLRTGTIMAVKQIPMMSASNRGNNRDVLGLVREEVELMSNLEHPHILRMFGATFHQNHVNVFVEWMAGGSVARYYTEY